MTDELRARVALDDAEAVAARRDEVAAAVRDHAGGLAYALARIQGGEYGRRSFTTDRGEWTLKHEAGEVAFLRFAGRGGGEVYVVSEHRPPEPDELARAMTDYAAFCEAFDAWIDTLAGTLDDVSLDLPPVAATDALVAERDRLVAAVRDACEMVAGELRRIEGDQGTFATRLDGKRWEIAWNRDGVRFLRVGGESGIYLLSQYGPPSVQDVRELAPSVSEFVAAYNEHVAALSEEDQETT